MELPNYSRQLMQQLRALRKEGQFCDCTILVGDSPHRAHKLVLAASSLLFRSILEGSDSVSIDTAVVSSSEFSCLLDMVYTGKLPPGKHNFTRIIAAADSLQMFDVAVGCKNILTSLMKQSTTATTITTHTQIRLQGQGAEPTASPKKASPGLGKDDVTTGARVKREMEKEVDDDGGGGGSEGGAEKEEPRDETAEEEVEDGLPCKQARLQLPEGTEESRGAKPQSSVPPAENTGPPVPVEESVKPGVSEDGHGSSILLEHSSELTELLTEVPGITELLVQAANTRLAEQERKAVCECCAGADPGLAMQRLMGGVREGSVSEGVLLTLLHVVQETAGPPPPPRLLRLLEDIETEEGVAMDTGGLDAEEHEENQPQSSSKSDDQLNDEEEGNEKEEGEQNQEEVAGDGEGTQAGAKQSPSFPQPSSQPSSQPYSCRWCSKAFAYRCRLVAHDKSCSLNQEVKQQCPQCPEVLPTLRALQRHRAQAHPETARVKRKVACDLCGRTFAHPSGMLYHKRTEHFEEKPFACEECGAKFAANSSLKNHMRLHTGEKPYHCKHCAMSFSVAAALAYHTKKKHSEGKMYSCQYCEVVFAQSIELTRHVRTHTGDKPYVCRECGKGFSQANGLSVHLQTFHNITEPHDCHKCRLSFPSLEAHRQHVQDRHPREFHQCPLCQKTFSSAALLDKHKHSHSGRKPFSCQLCMKSYQQLSGLWYHNRTTHPEVFSQSQKQLKRLVQCSVCLRFFPSASSLDKHQRNQHRGIIDVDGVVIGSTDLPPDPPALFPREEEELQEHDRAHHAPQEGEGGEEGEGEGLGCSLCPLLCASQPELQAHLLSCHMGALERGEGGGDEASTAQTTEEQDSRAEHVITLDQSQLGGSQQQVFVALGDGDEGQSSSEVVAVNMEDLLNGTVTFICREGQ